MAGFECDELSDALTRLGYQLYHANNKDYRTLPLHCHLCLVDLRFEGFMTEANYLVRELNPAIHVIVLINKSQLDSDEITTFITQFAWDYCTSPIHPERLGKCLGHGMGLARLKRQCIPQSDKLHQQDTFASQVMQSLFHQLERVAPTDIPVLIRGESGAGKELIARKLHGLSRRRQGPFIVVNCTAMAAGLVQSEWVSHQDGALTEAIRAQRDKIMLADGGSLFLDEIGDLPLALQVNLLHFLQEGLSDPQGDNGGRTVDVRIISATQLDVENAIDDGRFRLDLFNRLNGMTLEAPPLRVRRDDILPLAEGFMSTYLSEYGLPSKQLSAEAKRALLNYAWPGNVRELMNRIRRAVVLSDDPQISAVNLELMHKQDKTASMSLKSLRDDVEKQAIQAAILVAGGQAEEVANQLKISRASLYRLMDKHGLQLRE